MSFQFRRATVQNYKTGELETATYRISKTAWLRRDEHDRINSIYERVADVTGLNMETSEELQVSNYGIGGHYEPHFDFARVSATVNDTVLHCIVPKQSCKIYLIQHEKNSLIFFYIFLMFLVICITDSQFDCIVNPERRKECLHQFGHWEPHRHLALLRVGRGARRRHRVSTTGLISVSQKRIRGLLVTEFNLLLSIIKY